VNSIVLFNGYKALLFSLLVVFIACSQKKESPKSAERDFSIVNKLESYDIALERPQPGEWLFEHEESGQSFEQYIKAYISLRKEEEYLSFANRKFFTGAGTYHIVYCGVP